MRGAGNGGEAAAEEVQALREPFESPSVEAALHNLCNLTGDHLTFTGEQTSDV